MYVVFVDKVVHGRWGVADDAHLVEELKVSSVYQFGLIV